MERRPRSPSKRRTEPGPAARALRLLARREHTRLELARKLEPHFEDPAELQALLDDFTARGWLSDQRAVDQLVNAKRGRFGAARIRQALLERGVTEDVITPALAGLKESEFDVACIVWTKKFGTGPRATAQRPRQVRFLLSRGFSLEIAMRVVRSVEKGGDS